MTTTKQELYDVLLGLRDTYRDKALEMESAQVLDITGTGYANHQAEDATAVYEQTVGASTFRAVQTRLRQIDEALARYEKGCYGVCEDCGQEIDIARLEAIPYTSLCLRCAETRDYQARM
jgi:RNA polymerase-binding transcription factor DksA